MLSRWAAVGLCAALNLACSSDDDDPFIEVPDTFRATFIAGEVCMPSQIETGASPSDTPPNYTMTFTVQRHDCITFDLATLRIQQSWLCFGSQCDMAVLTLVRANRVPTEENCNALELVEPPADRSQPQTFTFDDLLTPPKFEDGEWVTGNFTVTIPFFDLEDGDNVVSRIEGGEPTAQVLMDYPQTDPNRKFVVEFVAGGPTSELECHQIPAP